MKKLLNSQEHIRCQAGQADVEN